MIKAKQVLKSITKINNKFFQEAESLLASFFLLAARIWMANIFFKSGKTKFANMDNTIYLFEYEYAVPIIPVYIAAILATATEISMPILLTIGLATRLAAIPLLFMTAIIQFTYLDLTEHLYWALLLGTIILYGPGKYSIDRIFKFREY